MDKIQLLQKLSEELSSKSIYDDFSRNIAILRSDNLRLGILGQPNTAKTTLINGLIGSSLPVSNLPSKTSYSITFGDDAKDTFSEGTNKLAQEISINSDWLKNNRIAIKEINNDIVPEETSAIDLCSMLSQCDCCVYLLNAQSALSRTDLYILQNLSDINMSVLLVVSRLDLLSENDRLDVYDYVKSNVNQYTNVKLVEISSSIKDSANFIKDAIEKEIKEVNRESVRNNFENFYFSIAIGQLFEVCQKHIDECNEKKTSIDKLAQEKLQKIDDKSVEWLKVETCLRQRIISISDKLRIYLSDRKEDMLRRLSHDVDICGDVKLFWEKDFSFRLEEMTRSELSGATQLVNQELIKVLQWLQDELLKQFRCKISLTTGIVGDRTKNLIQNTDEVSVADTQKLKIVTRIGTAATVIAAGALFATSGIGGVVMAVSMVSGLGAEFFMRKQANESKELIKKHLPVIVERANLQLVTDFDTKIQGVTNELIAHMQTLKADWLESSKKTIEQEKAIATFNLSSSKWNSIMDRINQLSELLIK